jgi:hypothetical protein
MRVLEDLLQPVRKIFFGGGLRLPSAACKSSRKLFAFKYLNNFTMDGTRRILNGRIKPVFHFRTLRGPEGPLFHGSVD